MSSSQFQIIFLKSMKKITFVEKQQGGTYDPVSTFFASKKPASVSKPASQATKKDASSKPNIINERVPSAKIVTTQNKKTQEKALTSKIGKKGDHLPPRSHPEGIVKKQQSIYGIGNGSKKNIRAVENKEYPQNENHLQREQKQQPFFPNVNERKSPNKTQNNNQTENRNGQQNSTQQVLNLKKKIKQLQLREQEYTKRIEQFQQKEEKFIKMQQKLSKIQKEQKNASGESKQYEKKLKEKQEQIKKLMSKDEIPFSKKRQVLLMNQLNSLKKTNRELVQRIKNYKGTDLVQISLHTNKADILSQQYDHSNFINQNGNLESIQNHNNDLSKVQSLIYRTFQSSSQYINSKLSNKDCGWADQKKFLMDLINNCKQLSLQCMKFEFKIPSDNKQCANMYNQIEKYRNSVQPLLSKYDLNFVITQQNIQLINRRNEELGTAIQLKQSIEKSWIQPKKFKKIAEAGVYYLNKYKQNYVVFEKSINFSNILLSHCLGQISFIQSWVNKITSNLKQQLKIFSIKLKQLEELSSLGENGKQSLCAYVKGNIGQWTMKIPELQLRIKEIGSIFKNVKTEKQRKPIK